MPSKTVSEEANRRILNHNSRISASVAEAIGVNGDIAVPRTYKAGPGELM